MSLLLCLALPCTSGSPQEPLLLRTHRATLDVRVGELLLEREVELDPTLLVDLYSVRRSVGPRRITLVSDLEELTLDLEPGRKVEISVELDGQRCPLWLSTLPRPAERHAPGTDPVRLPLRLEHGKLHVTGRINGSSELDLIFDTGASVCVLYPTALGKGAAFHGDLTVNNNVESRRQLDLDGEVEVEGLSWRHEPVLYVEKQVDRADGILGYTVFEDKVLEFDLERGELVVHESLPEPATEFTSVPLDYIWGLTALEIGFVDGTWEERGSYLLDTGADMAVMTSSGRLAQALNARLERIGTGSAGGVGPRTTSLAYLRAPELFFDGSRFENVGVHASLEESGPTEDPAAGVVGMELLRRFDLILDYPRATAYFRPNADFALPFGRAKKNAFPWPLGLALLGAAAGAFAWRRRSRRAA